MSDRTCLRSWTSVETSVEQADGYVSKHDPEVRYKEWLRQMNAYFVKATGLSTDETDDLPLRDWFDGGMKPDAAARNAVKRLSL
jgi:hypothetical protein